MPTIVRVAASVAVSTQWESFYFPWTAVGGADSYRLDLYSSADGVTYTPYLGFPLSVSLATYALQNGVTTTLPPATFWYWNVRAITAGTPGSPTADAYFLS